jgi:cysteine desulfurase
VTGTVDTGRAYLDWNATAPLRAEARGAALAALDVVGNPSSVHAEGRAARALVETARVQVARLMSCQPEHVVFTSGATEAAAQNETGVVQPVAQAVAAARDAGARALVDAAQTAGRLAAPEADYVLVSAHKLGGPKGVGALIARAEPPVLTGGQERGRRAGTENLAGIAGFGASAAAALRDMEACVWERVESLRDALEERILSAAPDAIVIGAGAPRLPNTTCLAVPGWRGETQVMQMDLAGVAVSAGSACSSGKTGPSRALRAMGLDETTAASAIRVSLGPTTTEAEIARFCDAWLAQYAKRRRQAA